MLALVTPQYIADLISWTAIDARTTDNTNWFMARVISTTEQVRKWGCEPMTR
jgi:phospho-2-dehydro-3-deoxyheptonate aldolase